MTKRVREEEKDMKPFPKGVCVKVKHLRPKYANLQDWLACDTHSLVTRHGRIFIGKEKQIFHYPASEWANPFTVKEYGLEECLNLYRQHLDTLLARDEACLARFKALAEMTQIGCFCEPGSPCHRDVILEKLAFYCTD